MNKLSHVVLGLGALLGACATDDPMQPPDDAAVTFRLRIENVAPWTVLKSGTQTTKVDGATGGAGPGGAFEITFSAGRHQKLSFASMLGQSNDWFFGPGAEGLALYNEDGAPISGDVTNQIKLYDAGTEYDQEPGVGDATGPRQPSPEFGPADPNPTVRELGSVVTLTDGTTFALPRVNQMVKAMLTPGPNGTFKLRFENVSTPSTLQTSAGPSGIGLSPLAWALHTNDAPLFTPGSADRGLGLEWIAESGRTQMLGDSLHALSGPASPVSPGLYAVHADPEPLYALGVADLGLGLERLAEDGNIIPLRDMLMADGRAMPLDQLGWYDTPVGAAQAGPARPGSAFELELTGKPGDHLSFASMLGWSNDWFFATRPEGIALFDAAGKPMRGDVSADVGLYDAGTEVDQELAIGADTGPQQTGPNTGAPDPLRIVREISADVHPHPASTHLRVTLAPL